MVPSTSHPPNPAPFSVEVGSSNRRSSYATCCFACGRVGTGRFTVRNWLDRHPKRFHRDSRKRTKKCIATVYRYLDLDTDGEAHLASLRASDAVPTPNAILSTSLGKYQVLWRVDGNTFEQQESTLKLFAIPSGAIPLAPTATASFACRDSRLASTRRRISSPSNAPAIPLGIQTTFGWIFQRRMSCYCPVRSHPESIPISTPIPNPIGPGF